MASPPEHERRWRRHACHAGSVDRCLRGRVDRVDLVQALANALMVVLLHRAEEGYSVEELQDQLHGCGVQRSTRAIKDLLDAMVECGIAKQVDEDRFVHIHPDM